MTVVCAGDHCRCGTKAAFGVSWERERWNIFWQLRGSVLDTDASSQARTEAHAVSNNRTQTAAHSVDEVHVSWEGATSYRMLLLGLAYQWAMPKCRDLGNFHVGFEGHLWQTAPIGLESTSPAFLEQPGTDPFGASIVTNAETNPDDPGFWRVRFGACSVPLNAESDFSL